MADYKKMFDSEGEPFECDCCGFPGKLSLFKGTDTENFEKKDMLFCEVCSKTYLSTVATYPRFVNDPNLYKSIAIIANMILEKLEGK